MKPIRVFLYIVFLFSSLSLFNNDASAALNQCQSDLQKADEIARETAAWFQYTTGPMNSEHLGQCGDYAVMFVLKYNE